MPETENKIRVKYLDSVVGYINRLVDILYEKEYFGSKEAAKQYVVDMKDYIEKRMPHILKKSAPPYFEKYGKSMQYVMYRPNKQTTWYIFFQRNGNRFLVRYITNNHVEGQYIR